jgi:zinc D-Ala-D-Ala carboxypeptidase
MNLTKNFTLEEMTKSETALRHDLENTPGEQEISAMKLLAEKVLQPVRDHFGKGVKVNSGFRNPRCKPKSRWITQLGPYTGASL